MASKFVRRICAGAQRWNTRPLSTTHSQAAPHYELSSEQREIQAVARKLAREEIIPIAAEMDRTMEFPWDTVKKMHEVGFLNITTPTEYGGNGLGMVEAAIIFEEICYGCPGFVQAMGGTILGQTPVLLSGNDKQKKKYLGRMAEKCHLAAFGCTEPGAGSDVSAIRTRAERRGDEWILNGQKMWITNAGHAEWLVVLARTDPNPKCPAGKAFTTFVMEADTPGITMGKKEINMGLRCGDARGFFMEDVVLTKENQLGEEGKGFMTTMASFDSTRPLATAEAIGVHQRALDEATKYSMERKTFGVPIAQHQAVSMMLADMAIGVEMGRLMMLRSAWEVDQGRNNTYVASIGKLWSADSLMKSAIDCVQIFGGNGFNTEYPAEKIMRDAKIFSIFEGTSQIQRHIIHKELMSNMAKQGM